jgi:tripartite-type tricarboxylate transporter receptor subunit TctC
LVAPAGTPDAVIKILHQAAVEALNDPGVRHSLAELGVDIATDTPEQFAAYIHSEIPKWAAVIKVSGAHLD